MEATMGHLLMNDQERALKAYFEMVKGKQLTLKGVSNQVDLGYRQIKRIYAKWKREGRGLKRERGSSKECRGKQPKNIATNEYYARKT